jgi:hypothetical protein
MIRKRKNISKKVMGDDTGSQVRLVIPQLFMNGFKSGLVHGDQCNYKQSNMSKNVISDKTGFEV